jgi:hypothetical protein
VRHGSRSTHTFAVHPGSVKGQAAAEGAASRLLGRVVRGGRQQPCQSTHAARTFCTSSLISGVPADMECALRPADARTTIHYNPALANIDRHVAHSVAAYLAGMAIC